MIVTNDQAAGIRIGQAAGYIYNPAVDVCIVRYVGDELAGGTAYTGFTGASIAMHVAGFRPNWVTRDLIWATFHYPFVQLGVNKVIGQVPAYNRRALEFDLKLGFIEETRVKDVFPDGDVIVLSMYKDQCRWLDYQPKELPRKAA